MQQHDHGAGGFAHDLVDQVERVFRALSESDERDVGSFPAGHGSDVFDFDLAGDDLVAERDDNRRYRREAVLALVGDQDAQMLGLAVSSSAAQARKSESWAPVHDGHRLSCGWV